MRRTNLQTVRVLALGLAIFSIALLAACSVNVKKQKDGEDKQVDINTPVGGIHVEQGRERGGRGHRRVSGRYI